MYTLPPFMSEVFSEKRQFMKFVGIFRVGIFLEPKKYQKKYLPDNSNHFVRHYENVSSDCMSNINSLNEDIVLSAQNVYMRTADKNLKKVCESKTYNKANKNKQWFNKESLIKEKELRLITKALHPI